MFMSIFSSFDALCAESLGQKVGFSFPLLPVKEEKQQPVIASVNSSSSLSLSIEEERGLILKNKEKEANNNNNNDSKGKRKKNQQERKARFAPELDGLHCFETIVPSY